MNSTLRNLLFWMGLVVLGVVIWEFSSNLRPNDEEIKFSEFLERVDNRKVEGVVIVGNDVTGTYVGARLTRRPKPVSTPTRRRNSTTSRVTCAKKA